MPALASAVELEARLGRELTELEAARADALLQDASAAVRAYTRQSFALTTDDTVVLRAQGGVIHLPGGPVVEISKVEAIGGSEALPDFTLIDWLFDEIDTIRIGEGATVVNMPEAWWDDDGYPGTYRVTYTHGYATVPAEVVRVVCGMVLRTLTAPTMAGGVTSETVGPYSYRMDTPGTGLAVHLTETDRAELKAYRRTVGQIQVRRG